MEDESGDIAGDVHGRSVLCQFCSLLRPWRIPGLDDLPARLSGHREFGMGVTGGSVDKSWPNSGRDSSDRIHHIHGRLKGTVGLLHSSIIH